MPNEKIILQAIRPILPGTVYESQIKCGKKNCKCYTDPKVFHTLYQWSGNIDGKNTSRSLTKEMYLECKKRTAKYKMLRELLKKECNEALKNAPWIKKS